MTVDPTPRVHGGDPGTAMERHGGRPEEWLDLSTGINPVAYPLPEIPPLAWTTLPARRNLAALEAAAAAAYGTNTAVVALAGAQAAIQMVPRVAQGSDARVLGPTYEEHAGALSDAGWDVTQVRDLEALASADLAVVVNPNNPDGQHHAAATLLGLAPRVGLLVVDESFADAAPDASLAPGLEQAAGRVLVLRSFGKFYGLAGLRLGFVLDGAGLAPKIRTMAGPWQVSGPAVEIGRAALGDVAWQAATRARLLRDTARLDALADAAGWACIGGTALFRTYAVGDAGAVQERLARSRIWTRSFPYAPTWLRLGLPGTAEDWARLTAALPA